RCGPITRPTSLRCSRSSSATSTPRGQSHPGSERTCSPSTSLRRRLWNSRDSDGSSEGSSGFQNGVATGEPLPGGRGSPDALPHTVTTTGAVDSLCRNLAWIIVSVVRSADRPVSRRGSVEPLSGRRGRPDAMGLVEGVTLLHPPPHPDRADRL